MLKLVYTVCALSLTAHYALAEDFKDRPKAYLKDSNLVTHISSLVLPTLAFNKDKAVPSAFVSEKGPLLFQNGKEVALDSVNQSQPYCAIGGSYTNIETHQSENEQHVFKAGQRLRIKKALAYESAQSKINLRAEKFSHKKEYTVDILLQGGFKNSEMNEMYLENGAITKTAFPYPEDDFNVFFGNLKCFKFSKVPTVGDIRKIIGSENLSIMPDQTEPMAFRPGEADFRNHRDGVTTELKEFFKSLTNQVQDSVKSESINSSSFGKDSSSHYKPMRASQTLSSRQ